MEKVTTERAEELKTLLGDYLHGYSFQLPIEEAAEAIRSLAKERDDLAVQLDAAQAVIAKKNYGLHIVCGPVMEAYAGEHRLLDYKNLVSIPSDDTVLRAMLSERWNRAAEAQREAAASLCEKSDRYRGDYFAALIRTMPLVIDSHAEIERKHLGDPDKRTGIYLDQEDAARYRWLRDAPATQQDEKGIRQWLFSRPAGAISFDDFIDEARK